MPNAASSPSPLRRQLEAYAETWRADHIAAMACLDVEDAIAVGLSVFSLLWDREHHWRDEVFRGGLPFRSEDDLDHQPLNEGQRLKYR